MKRSKSASAPAASAASKACWSAGSLSRHTASRSMTRSLFSAAAVRRLRPVDPQIDRVAEAPAAREVGAGRLHGGQRRVQGVEQQHPRVVLLRRPAGQPAEVGQVADPPALARSDRIELGGPPPCPEPFGQVAAAGADDEEDLGVIPAEPVIADGQVLGQRAVIEQRDVGAVLGVQLPASALDAVAGPGEPQGRDIGRALLVAGAHGLEHGVDRGPRGLDPRALVVVVPGIHPPRRRCPPCRSF